MPRRVKRLLKVTLVRLTPYLPGLGRLRSIYRTQVRRGSADRVASTQRQKDAFVARISGIDAASRERLEAFENVYMGQNGREHVETVARLHARRYFAMSEILSSLSLAPGAASLEVGCGPGIMSMVLASEHPDLKCSAVDRYQRPIEIGVGLARALKLRVNLLALEGAQVDTAFPADSFDVVFLCEVLEHMEYGEAQRGLLTATLKAGGTVIVTVPYEDRIPSPGHLTDFTRATLTALLEPFAGPLRWHEAERTDYGLENHFIVSFSPRAATTN